MSKQNHLRYRNSRRLNELVGKVVSLYENNNKNVLFDYDCLTKREDGFYLGEKKIPLRSIYKISRLDVHLQKINVDPIYLEDPKGERRIEVIA
jgi:hypothetical protein